MENLRIYAATYNVGSSGPVQDLRELLSMIDIKNENLPDLFILGFQEVKAQPQNMLLDNLFEDPWTYACKEVLQKDYIKLKSVRLQGLLIILFALRKHLVNVREIESYYTRTGMGGMWGNKGAVSIRLNMYGCSLCFVNAHLSAHDEHLKDRVDNYNSIIKDQEFHVAETSKIFYHDYVFWMGDLNFRLNEDYGKTPDQIEQMILKKNHKILFEHDQLRTVMRNGEAFSELFECVPEFPPTFKFVVGTPFYDHKRRPAWCDRILHCVNSDNYENVTLQVNQLSYKCHPSYTLSDHRPVSAEFVIMIPQEVLKVGRSLQYYAECVIEFDKIIRWKDKEVNKVMYRVTKDVTPTREDWIGLFKVNFSSLDDYITYEYVSKCTSPCQQRRGGSPKVPAPLEYEVTFSQLPSRCRGNYHLVYFSQTEDKVTSVLGMSDPFPIVKTDSN